MAIRLLHLNRLQRKVLLVILTIVVVPMLVAGAFASEWVSTFFERRLEQWIVEAARVDQTWLKAYQNDATMLGSVLADQPEFVESLDRGTPQLDPVSNRIAQELGITFMQVYTANQHLVYSSSPMQRRPQWVPGQTQAVLKVTEHHNTRLAAVGITGIPRDNPRYYLVLGSLLDQDFIDELSQLTGLQTRIYYREGTKYWDIFSDPGRALSLRYISRSALWRLQVKRKPYYDVQAENGHFRGLYTPIVDAEGRVEAIMFSGLARRGVDNVITNQAVLFLAISALGLVVGGLTGLLLSRLVVHPIEHLRNAVMQLAGQNFNTTVPITSQDELGDLAKAFNAMAVRLREARDEQQQTFKKDKLAALGELSAALAHEIRNPIGVINTAAALMDKPDPRADKQAELLRMIREESMRVNNLVQDFLQLSRYRQPEFGQIDPAAPMERSLAASLAGRSDITVDKHLDHGDARVHADPRLLQQAWNNLFANALEAMGANGGRLRIESAASEGRVTIAVEDSGPGIDADVMPRLFEPFFTTKEHGTGLGLSIAYTLVDANGGVLEATAPESDSGARFEMHFPIYEKFV